MLPRWQPADGACGAVGIIYPIQRYFCGRHGIVREGMNAQETTTFRSLDAPPTLSTRSVRVRAPPTPTFGRVLRKQVRKRSMRSSNSTGIARKTLFLPRALSIVFRWKRSELCLFVLASGSGGNVVGIQTSRPTAPCRTFASHTRRG